MMKTGGITLTFLGALTLADYYGQPNTRNVYRGREDCVADYSEAQCVGDTGNSGHGGGSGGGRWYGPGYRQSGYSAGDPGPGRASRAIMSEPIQRGGFGSYARSFFSGGG